MPYKLHPYQKELVAEARDKLSKGKKSVLIVSPPGSGKSVIISEIARLAAEKDGFVLFLVHRKELVAQITNTFHTAEIPDKNFLAITVGKVSHRYSVIPWPSLIITDESHHALAKTYRDIYDHYAGVPKLGFTATPWRLNGAGLDEVYDDMVEGPTVKWLIDNHFLSPFEYYGALTIDTSKLRRSSTGDYSNKSIDDAFGKFVFGDTIKQYREHANGKQAIVYAYSVNFSKRVAAAFNTAGIYAAHADAKTPAVERDKIMTDFKSGKLKVLCNVDLVSEGYDVPDCGVVILLRPTKSLVVFLQQSMRGMRYRPNKLSVIIDQVGNFKEHGLPDFERQWTLHSRPKKHGIAEDKVFTCEECLAVFREWKVSVDKYGNQLPKKDGRTQLECPECGEPKPDPEQMTEKDAVDTELQELTGEQGRLAVLAEQRISFNEPAYAYRIVDAQIKIGKRKAKNPIYSVVMTARARGVTLTPGQLADIADVSGQPYKVVKRAWDWACKKRQPVQNVFNF